MDTDLIFAYDSAQLGIPRTRKITKFVYDITTGLDFESGRLKVGRLMENCLSNADRYLTRQVESMDFDDIYFPDFRRLIRHLAAQGFAEPYGARRYAKKVTVLFVDEETENLKQAVDELVRLRDTRVFVVAIGEIDMYTAALLATKPVNDHMVHVPSYKYLHTAKSTLQQKMCRWLSEES